MPLSPCRILFILTIAHLLFIQLTAQHEESLSSNLKRKCFQCTMPYECNLGLCYGDYCIKSLASDQYVSKGCENKTFRLVNGESYMQGSSESIEKSHCTTEYMFGIENVICYCNDIDFCNRSRKIEGRM
ncbi:Translation initiation factor 2 subunit gamma [Dirofilaria immitis]